MARPVKHYNGWRVRWIDYTGTRCSETLGSRKEADLHLAARIQEADEIRRGIRLPIKEGQTFANLCDYWLEHRAKDLSQKRSCRSDRSIIDANLRPFFGNTLLLHLSIELVDLYKGNKSTTHSPKTLHNHLTLIISMLNLAKDLRWLAQVPKIKKPRISLDTTQYAYLRTDREISQFLHSAAQEGYKAYAFYATAVYTGLRAGEAAALRWSDMSFDTRLITVQRSFVGPTKSGRVRYVPILDSLLPILKEWRLRCPGDLMFPNERGNMHKPSDRIFQEIFHRVLDHSGLPKVFRRGKQRHALVFHSLRHTFASHWVMKGGDIFKLQKILGHQSMMLTQRYAHLAPNAFDSDFSRFGACAPPEHRATVIALSS